MPFDLQTLKNLGEKLLANATEIGLIGLSATANAVMSAETLAATVGITCGIIGLTTVASKQQANKKMSALRASPAHTVALENGYRNGMNIAIGVTILLTIAYLALNIIDPEASVVASALLAAAATAVAPVTKKIINSSVRNTILASMNQQPAAHEVELDEDSEDEHAHHRDVVSLDMSHQSANQHGVTIGMEEKSRDLEDRPSAIAQDRLGVINQPDISQANIAMEQLSAENRTLHEKNAQLLNAVSRGENIIRELTEQVKGLEKSNAHLAHNLDLDRVEKSKLQKELEQTHLLLAPLEQQLEVHQKAREELSGQAKQLSAEITTLKLRLSSSESDKAELTKQIETLTAKLEETTKRTELKEQQIIELSNASEIHQQQLQEAETRISGLKKTILAQDQQLDERTVLNEQLQKQLAAYQFDIEQLREEALRAEALRQREARRLITEMSQKAAEEPLPFPEPHDEEDAPDEPHDQSPAHDPKK